MTLTHVAVELRSLGGKDTLTTVFFIDTGLSESIAPASELKRIGIEPAGKREYEGAEGERLEFEYAFVEMRFLDEIVATRILFGPDDAEPRLGRLALTSAGFIVDSTSQTFRKRRALPLKQALAK